MDSGRFGYEQTQLDLVDGKFILLVKSSPLPLNNDFLLFSFSYLSFFFCDSLLHLKKITALDFSLFFSSSLSSTLKEILCVRASLARSYRRPCGRWKSAYPDGISVLKVRGMLNFHTNSLLEQANDYVLL